MPNTTTCTEQLTSPGRPAHQFAISRQSPLIADLIERTYPANADDRDSLRAQELAYKLGTVGIHCLLAPLKEQLDQAVSRVQEMI